MIWRVCLLLVTLLFVACKSSPPQSFPQTNHVDSVEYTSIEKRFKLESIYRLDNYLGGLQPNYAIAGGRASLLNKDTGRVDWPNGGLLPIYHVLLIKKDNGYALVKNKRELKDVYAPITSKEEALAYAILNTKYFPVLDQGYFKFRYRYFHGKPSLSYAVKEKNYYLVHLFDNETFGCDHPYYSILLKVTAKGEVIEFKKEQAFEDPRQDGLCVD